MRSQPLVVGRAGDAEHGRTGALGQPHGYRAHPAGSVGNGDGVTGRQFDRADGGVCRGTGHEQAARAFP